MRCQRMVDCKCFQHTHEITLVNRTLVDFMIGYQGLEARRIYSCFTILDFASNIEPSNWRRYECISRNG